MDKVLDYIEQNQKRYLAELEDFLRIPSISNDPNKKEAMVEAAEFVEGQLRDAGLEDSRLFKTGGPPLVFGASAIDPDKPTVLIYAHYDVQPVDPLHLWDSPPFEPEVRDGRLYARGSADDKGQMMIHFKSVEAFVKSREELPVNIKFLIEGEEEIGSEHLDNFIEENVDLLAADAVLISDTAMFGHGIPSICYGLRGMAYLEIVLTGPKSDLHSGSFGGPVANPAFVLAEILASMKDAQGRITIPGFYDNVVELTERERNEWANLPFDEDTYKAELGVDALNGESGYTPLEQLWVRPTLEINGLLSGFTGEGAKTVLPSTAMAKISMRLVPDQDYKKIEDLFCDYVRSKAPASVTVDVKRLHGGRPWVASLDHPALVTAGTAIEKGFGKRPVFQREGGSIPIVATFQELLGVPCVLMGIGLPDENSHAPNEWLDLGNFYNGIRSSAFFLDEFAKQMS